MNNQENIVTLINPLLVKKENNCIQQSNLSNNILNNKYVLLSKLKEISGEADIYTCKYNDQYYIAKIFKKDCKINNDVLDVLVKIDSKYIEKVEDYFYLDDGRFVEITSYYNQGSLLNQKFTSKELKELIIPSLNEAIHILHKNNILHLDIKPANIMFSNDKKNVVLIDFGSSIVINNENEIISRDDINFTPLYTAPETNISGQCSIYSDYYSMGIVIYELLLGHSPFIGLNKEQIISFSQTNRLAFDDDTSLDMRDLILGLTYRDIANRNDYNNVNNRWSYKHVCDWLDGKSLVVPGEGILSNSNMIPFVFKNKYYTQIDTLIEALAISWNEGMIYLNDKHLSNHFKNINHKYYEICIEFESRFYNKDIKLNKDEEFFKFLYTMLPKLEKFYYKGEVYESIQHLGFSLKELLDTKKINDRRFDLFEDILNQKILSIYCKFKEIEDQELLDFINHLELSSKINFSTPRNKMKTLYAMSYALTGQKEYEFDGKIFRSKDELVNYIHKIYQTSFVELNKLCRKLMPRRRLDIKLEAWLCALGYHNAILEFNKVLNYQQEDDIL